MPDAVMRRQDKLIADLEEQRRLLDDALVLRLGLVDGDRPYVVPMNFARDGDVLWLHCAAAGGLKIDCIRRGSSACFEVDELHRVTKGPRACGHWTSHYSSVVGYGRPEIVEDEALKLHGLRMLMQKYSGRGDWEFEEAQVRKTCVIRVRIESLTGKRSPA